MNFCFWFGVYYFPLIISEGRKMVVEGLERLEGLKGVERVEGLEREVWRVVLHKMRDQLAASLSFDLDRTTLLQAFSPY
jgi:hypothetical protein